MCNLVAPVRTDNQHPHVVNASRQKPKQIQRALIGPVHILDNEDPRAIMIAQTVEQPAEQRVTVHHRRFRLRLSTRHQRLNTQERCDPAPAENYVHAGQA